MAVTADKLAETVAMIAQRDEQFQVIDDAMKHTDDGVPLIPLSAISVLLGEEGTEKKMKAAVDRAKISTRKNGRRIDEHFQSGLLFGDPEEIYLTVYSSLMVIINAHPDSDLVAKAQDFFAARSMQEIAEEEKRIKHRFEVNEENKKLSSAAKQAGVRQYGKFTNYGYRGMYGGLVLREVAKLKGLENPNALLDYAGAEELASHLFRITQTRAKLVRDRVKSEDKACLAHLQVGQEVRRAIKAMGGTMPEKLPLAHDRIGEVNSRTKRRLKEALE